MNYYEFHIGDYLKNTAHLSMLEDSAYRRLIDAYYTREAPLPIERRACHKLCRASSKDEREAVDYVLDEFFTQHDDGWHNDRCDEEIASYYAKKPAAEEKRENAKERQRKARERRKAIFEELSSHGIHMPWNATTEQAQAELSRVKSQPVTCDNTATQTPVPSHQSPGLTSSLSTSTVGTYAGAVCARLKSEAGMLDVNPLHPKLLALIDAGITDDELVAAGHEAKQRGKGFAYAMATAEGRRRDAANVQALPTKSSAGQKTAAAAARWLESQGAQS